MLSKLSKQTLKVTMLGHTGVGKTSLLCAIYDQFDQIIGKTNLQLTPNSDTKNILDTRLKELKDSVKHNNIKIRGGLTKTTKSLTHLFTLGKTGTSPTLELQFQDYPGDYIVNNQTEVEKFMEESAAILIAIDTPALMENNGQWHETFNQPQQIFDLFKSSFQNLNSPKLVILAPIKCEKYLQQQGGEERLVNTIQEKYANLLSFFRSDALVPYIASVLTPVETLGSVICSRVEEDKDNQGEFIFYFRKSDPNKFYEPKNSEQPLRYLLKFILNLHLEHRQIPVLENIFRSMGKDKDFINAVSEFANGCKSNGAFTVFQRSNL